MVLLRLAQTMLRVDRSMPHRGNTGSLVIGAELNWRLIYFVCFKMEGNYMKAQGTVSRRTNTSDMTVDPFQLFEMDNYVLHFV